MEIEEKIMTWLDVEMRIVKAIVLPEANVKHDRSVVFL
jgi:hypothetical protein